MASLVLRSPALAGLPAARAPRLLAYRVVAREAVGGRLRPLARTDRVLAALDRAVDPNEDGDTADGADVILMGLTAGFDGGGVDPVAQALEAADRVGATVVVPAGNDGPTFARPGSIGGPAAARTAIAVGGLSAPAAPRTADLEAQLGPAAARLGPLPLIGREPDGAGVPVVLLQGPDGLVTGDAPGDYRTPEGASRVQGALAVVTRGGGTIAEKAAQAAAAGAAGLVVWDEVGPASFPAIPDDGSMPIPVVGVGAQQGRALAAPGRRQARPARRPAGRGERGGRPRPGLVLVVGAHGRRAPEAGPDRARRLARGGVARPRAGRRAPRGGADRHQRGRRRGRRPGAAPAHRPARARAARRPLAAGAGGHAGARRRPRAPGRGAPARARRPGAADRPAHRGRRAGRPAAARPTSCSPISAGARAATR